MSSLGRRKKPRSQPTARSQLSRVAVVVTALFVFLYVRLLWNFATPSSSSLRRDVYTGYKPSPVEAYFSKNAAKFGWGDTKVLTSTCQIWNNATATTMHPQLSAYVQELFDYNARVRAHAKVPDVRVALRDASRDRRDICAALELHPDGLPGIFQSGQLSYTPAGYVEPLLPPLRHPLYCMDGLPQAGGKVKGVPGVTLAAPTLHWDMLLDLGYLIQDFAVTCRKSHKATSRNIFIDMGASLEFHGGLDMNKNPAIYLVEMFAKFGFPFDHIYAFEVTQIAPEDVYKKVPQEYIHAYHWINLPVSPDPHSKQNPLQLLLNDYDEDDLIVVKLDIDTPAVEMAMIQQILDDKRFGKLIDHFYFEHHVYLNELAVSWGTGGMKGSLLDSLELFQKLREKGIAAHYWP